MTRLNAKREKNPLSAEKLAGIEFEKLGQGSSSYGKSKSTTITNPFDRPGLGRGKGDEAWLEFGTPYNACLALPDLGTDCDRQPSFR